MREQIKIMIEQMNSEQKKQLIREMEDNVDSDMKAFIAYVKSLV